MTNYIQDAKTGHMAGSVGAPPTAGASATVSLATTNDEGELLHCFGCGQQVPEGDLTTVLGDKFCEECYDNLNDSGWRADDDVADALDDAKNAAPLTPIAVDPPYGAERTHVAMDDIIWELDDEVTLPAGSYWIGDPGYIIGVHEGYENGDVWVNWLEESGALDDGPRTEAYVGELPDGNVAVAFSTGYGDGLYPWMSERNDIDVLDEFDSPVDAGMLGIVPASYVPEGVTPRHMHLVRFEEPVRCYVDTGLNEDMHDVHFGDLYIRTMAEANENDEG